MRIGELSRRTGVPTRMLRYYEEQDLLRPEQAANNYRCYSPLAASGPSRPASLRTTPASAPPDLRVAGGRGAEAAGAAARPLADELLLERHSPAIRSPPPPALH
jgi:hypothetical protein